MNDATIRLEVRTEVSTFVDQVRARLSDLSDEEREELVGGLAADIAELVADGGSVTELGDPRAYADELRAAAGIERLPETAGASGRGFLGVRRRAGRPVGEPLGAMLDAVRDRWLALVGTPGLSGVWEVLTSVRPVWWVVRAWVAVELLDYAIGNGRYGLDLIPTTGTPLIALLLLIGAVVTSVQIGRGRLWPGTTRGADAWPRLLLVGLNAFAVLALAFVVPQLPTQEDVNLALDRGYRGGMGGDVGGGLVYQGEAVQNVFPYDAQGQPLSGVQLFDQNGRPLRLDRTSEFLGWDDHAGDRWSVNYPWMNGGQQLFNVVPLPTREQQRSGRPASAWLSENPPALPTPPLAVVPPASLPSSAADEPTADQAVAEKPSDATDGEESDARPKSDEKSGKRDSEKREGR